MSRLVRWMSTDVDRLSRARHDIASRGSIRISPNASSYVCERCRTTGVCGVRVQPPRPARDRAAPADASDSLGVSRATVHACPKTRHVHRAAVGASPGAAHAGDDGRAPLHSRARDGSMFRASSGTAAGLTALKACAPWPTSAAADHATGACDHAAVMRMQSQPGRRRARETRVILLRTCRRGVCTFCHLGCTLWQLWTTRWSPGRADVASPEEPR